MLALVMFGAGQLSAQQTGIDVVNTPPSQLPPIKPLGAVFAKSKEFMKVKATENPFAKRR